MKMDTKTNIDQIKEHLTDCVAQLQAANEILNNARFPLSVLNDAADLSILLAECHGNLMATIRKAQGIEEKDQ
jgi:hypothetical protein